MNISQIKAHIVAKLAIPGFELPVLTLNTQVDKSTGETTDWVSHWDDDYRVRISMPREVMDQIKADPTFSGLAIKKPEVVTPADEAKAPYTRVIIITPTSIEATF